MYPSPFLQSWSGVVAFGDRFRHDVNGAPRRAPMVFAQVLGRDNFGLRTLLFFSDAIFRFTVAPLRQSLGPGQSLIGTGVTEAFFIEIKVAIAGGVFSPVRLFSTRSGALLLRVFRGPRRSWSCRLSCVQRFFLGGTFFCYRIVLPVAFQYFIEQYGTIGVTPAIRIGEYFTFFFA